MTFTIMRHERRTARKAHQCFACQDTIAPKERYVVVASADNGTVDTAEYHLGCSLLCNHEDLRDGDEDDRREGWLLNYGGEWELCEADELLRDDPEMTPQERQRALRVLGMAPCVLTPAQEAYRVLHAQARKNPAGDNDFDHALYEAWYAMTVDEDQGLRDYWCATAWAEEIQPHTAHLARLLFDMEHCDPVLDRASALEKARALLNSLLAPYTARTPLRRSQWVGFDIHAPHTPEAGMKGQRVGVVMWRPRRGVFAVRCRTWTQETTPTPTTPAP